ncbi:MAG: hypothetical protein LBV20_05555 [Treponema sp.]|jgi:hypothetical protein|nr:hypothetical protein [Treponema sp.]
MYKPFLFLILGLSLLFVSCSARISGTIHENGSADLSIQASLEPKTAALLQSFSPNSGDFSIDSASIGASASAAPGVSSAQFVNINPTSIDGTIKIEKIDDFLLTSESSIDAYRFIQYEQNAEEGSLSINVDLTKGPIIISLFSPDVADYLSAIMAPLATGEVLSVAEYLDLVSTIYGSTVSNEIKNAIVNIDLVVPGTIQSVKGGTFVNNRAHFSVPLTELLVLETPVSYEIAWNNL